MEVKNAKIFGFEIYDIINAMIDVPPNDPHYVTMTVNPSGDYLEIMFVGPDVCDPATLPDILKPDPDEEKPTEEAAGEQEDHLGSDEPSDTHETRPAPRGEADWGKLEKEAYRLCSIQSFQLFIGGNDREAAIERMKEFCQVKDFQEIDKNRYKAVNLHDTVGNYQAWLAGEDGE